MNARYVSWPSLAVRSRNEGELEVVARDIDHVVHYTMQPGHVSTCPHDAAGATDGTAAP